MELSNAFELIPTEILSHIILYLERSMTRTLLVVNTQFKALVLKDAIPVWFDTIVIKDFPHLFRRRLASMTFIKSLDVSRPGSMTIATNHTIAKLTNLTSLKLDFNCHITQVNNTNIKHLSLCGNTHIANAALTKLDLLSLNLTNNARITDAVVSKMTNLTSLKLKNNGSITNASVSKLVNLTFLDVSYNSNHKVSELAVSQLTNLRWLDVTSNYSHYIKRMIDPQTRKDVVVIDVDTINIGNVQNM